MNRKCFLSMSMALVLAPALMAQTESDAAGRAGRGLAERKQSRNKSEIGATHDGGPRELPALASSLIAAPENLEPP